MSGPWEKYQTAQAAEDGPWAKYAKAEPVEKAPDPTEGNSFLQNAVIGIGSGINDMRLGVKQRGAEAIDAVFGTKYAPGVVKEVEEKRVIDAPLKKTAGGNVGSIGIKAAPAIAAAFIPGGQTLIGSALAGAATGFIEPTVDGESVAQNSAFGGAGGAAGYGVGKGVAFAADKLAARTAAKAAANSKIDAIAAQAKDAGLTIPPTQTNPTLVNRALEGLAGKISTGQAASVKNQPVINKMASNALGLDPSKPITREALDDVRRSAGAAYDALKQRGAFAVDSDYLNGVASLSAKNTVINNAFPGIRGGGMHGDPVEGLVHSLTPRNGALDAEATIEAIKQLRFQASGNLKNFQDPVKVDLGKAQRKAADLLESLIDRNLAQSGDPALLGEFRNARQLIAKTYSVEKALNDSTGNVVAGKLAKELDKGKPLSGELKQIAEFGQAFPKAAQEVTSSMPGISPLDFFGAGGLSAATGSPLAMSTVLARPVTRSVILSKPFQATAGTPAYTNRLAEILASQPSRIGMQVGGMMALPELAK